MSVTMPGKTPLDLPPGDPSAVDDLVRDVEGAGYRLASLADVLAGPAAAAPGWLGADATAATTQLARVAGITRAAADAVLAARSRLSAHGELLRDTRREVTALREEQDEDFRSAWRRLGDAQDLQLAVMTGAPAWAGEVAEVEASEARRCRRHRVLLEELADDAAATARALADAGRPLGGTGRAGDGGRVLAHLAAELPGWGDPELASRGVELAARLRNGPLTPSERAALAAEAAAYSGSPAFATTLVRGLGTEGVAGLLRALGSDPVEAADDPVAALLAAALGAAVPGDHRRDGIAAALGATYVRADDLGADAIAIGMAAVLVAGERSGGPRAGTVAEWARQLLRRERHLGTPAGMTVTGWGRRGEAGDPLAVAVGTLARSGDPGAAAALLADGAVWEGALGRFWGDDGAALGEVVRLAGSDAGAAGERAVLAGLETIGAGLVAGDPDDRTLDRGVVEAVSRDLAAAVAAHVDVVAGALSSVATERGGEAVGDVLRGLGSVSVDRQAAATLEQALAGWAAAQPHDLAGSSRSEPLPAVAVPSAYLAVREYGQRLSHAMDGFEVQDEAEDEAALWDWTAGLLLEVVSYAPAKPVGLLADVVGAYAPLLLGVDGSYEVGPDGGLRFDADDAVDGALAVLPPELSGRAAAVGAQAEASFRRAGAVLGAPAAPDGVRRDYAAATTDLVADLAGGQLIDGAKDRATRAATISEFLPGRR
ncbi:hypothetical protein [Blastococcus litoris]|uniref:hypothetical protein n=1 Tax=Blastococcus litoris TaxID=2171622 RepID=UPI0013DF1010|nr:hypothetical protein [Blastococcus litoris]